MASRDEDRPTGPSGAAAGNASNATRGSEDLLAHDRAGDDDVVSVGDLIGRYRLIRTIGRGGMGVVWLARHEQHGLQVALKTIHRGRYTQSDGVVAREFRHAAKLHHNHIVKVFDTGIHITSRGARIPYVVIEIIPAAQAIDTYAQGKRLSIHETLRLFLHACDAVAHVHSAGDMRCDIKPGNILIDATMDARSSPTSVSPAQCSAGPRASLAEHFGFMGPEQLAGDAERIDKRADVWALGASLYRLLTDHDPHDLPTSATRAQRLDAVRHPPRALTEAEPSLRRKIPELIGPLESIVQRSMAPDRDERFLDAGDFAAALRAALDRGTSKAWANARRSRWWTPVAIATAIGLAVPVGFMASELVLTRSDTLRRFLAQPMPAPAASLAIEPMLNDVVMIPLTTETGGASSPSAA